MFKVSISVWGEPFFVLNNFSDFSRLSVMNNHVYNQKTNATKLLTCVTDDLRCEGLVEEGTRG